jgi:predicted RNA-binding protein with PUA-like domain
MTLTIEEIESAWDEYGARKVLRGMKNGKEVYFHLNGKRVDATGLINARTVGLEAVISFPEFLRTKWQK